MSAETGSREEVAVGFEPRYKLRSLLARLPLQHISVCMSCLPMGYVDKTAFQSILPFTNQHIFNTAYFLAAAKPCL